MSTNSFIGIKTPDNKIKGIYCHWDGYIENNGLVLQKYYDNEDKINQLINLGSISSLGIEIGTKTDFNNPGNTDLNTIAYHRDRGEDLEIQVYDNPKKLHNYGCYEYAYIYDPDEKKWLLFDLDTDTYKDLEPIINNYIINNKHGINDYVERLSKLKPMK